jgi:hypothetical protein
MRRWSFSKFRPRFGWSRSDSPSRLNPFLKRDSLPPEAMRAFAETVLWCSRQELRAHSDDPDYLRNERLIKQRSFLNVDFNSLRPLFAQLRSPALQPSVDVGEIRSEEERARTIAQVIALRSHLVAAEGPINQDSILAARLGRLLHYWPAENVSDGASEVGSLGFFNENDVPPWDT